RGELVRYDIQSGQFVPYLGGISASSLSFSADGQWVAYQSYPPGQIWRSRADGTEKLQVTGDRIDGWSPEISSDGRQIVFVAQDANYRQRIYVAGTDGGTPQEISPGEMANGRNFSSASIHW